MLKLEKYVEEINDKCFLCNKRLKSILILKYMPIYFLIIIQN
jgi:PP-loop superfamily ATP-utilizing enzyme